MYYGGKHDSTTLAYPGVGPEALLRDVLDAAAKPARRVGAHVLVLEHGLRRRAVRELTRFPEDR